MPSFKAILGILFVLLTASISILAALALRSYGETSTTARRVQRTSQVIEQVDEITSAYKAVQQESNAAFMQPNTIHVNRYTQAKDVLGTALDSLEFLTADNPEQQRKLGELNSLLGDLIRFTDSAFSDQSTRTLPDFNILTSKNNDYRYAIQPALDVLKAQEKNLLTFQQASNQESISRSRNLTLALLLFVFLTIGTTFLSIRHNFNKLVRVEEDLLKANELFFKLFYESPVGLVITNPDDGVVVDCNDVYAQLINYSREQIIGQTAKSLNILGENVHRERYIEEAHQKGSARGVEVLIYPKDRKAIWANISLQPIQLKERECLLSAVQDVTTHKEAEATIQLALDKEIELNKLKSNFVSLASHEFRTPLTTVLSSAFLLENYLPMEAKEKTAKHISRIKSSVNTLTNILDEFLSLTKIEEGKTIPLTEELDIKALFSALCASQQVYAKTGQLITYSHSGNQSVISDPGILTGIATNLISNAIKYSPERAAINVSSTCDEGKFKLTVTDTGMGIPFQDQQHLFERFYRASNAGNVQGTGLGLHITKHYVDLLNGSIQFQSQPGQGCAFTVSFSFNHQR